MKREKISIEEDGVPLQKKKGKEGSPSMLEKGSVP